MLTTLRGDPVVPLGLAAVPSQDPRCVKTSFLRGVSYFFCYSLEYELFIRQLSAIMRKQRDRVVVATGSGARRNASLLAARKKMFAAFHCEQIDVFFAEYINPGDDPALIFGDGGVLDQLQHWKAQGSIRFVGATTHDRGLAYRLAEDPRVDVLMHRFNMAHRKAVQEVFPAAIRSRTPIVAFTATRWGTLLENHPDWPGKPPTATDCYRFCLAQPAVHLVLTAPKSLAELEENLAVLQAKRMSKQQSARWERFGDLVHSRGSDAFETRWP